MFKNILNTFGTRALSAVINLLIAIVLSQFLGPAGKGQQGLIITTITFILVFSNLVGGATLVYLVPRREHSQLLLPSYSWTIIMSLLAVPILSYFNLVEGRYVIHVCILAALNSFAAIHTSVLIGKERIKLANLVALLQPLVIILSLAVFFFVLDWKSIWAYIFALYISFCITLIISYFLVVKELGSMRVKSFSDYVQVMGEMFRYGFYNQVAHITQMLSFRVSYYFLDAYHGEAAVGVYSNGISLAESLWLIAKSISLVQYARISNTSDRKYAQRLTMQLSKASMLISIIFLVPLLLLPSGFYSFIFGEGFSDVRLVIWALAPGVVIYNFSILLGHYFSGTGRYHINAIASTLGLVVSLILYFAMIPAYSITGAGIATSISYLFTTLVLLVFFIRDDAGNFISTLSFRGDLESIRREIRGLFKV
jgi:O-antigen/teichoic acid export membrane protein